MDFRDACASWFNSGYTFYRRLWTNFSIFYVAVNSNPEAFVLHWVEWRSVHSLVAVSSARFARRNLDIISTKSPFWAVCGGFLLLSAPKPSMMKSSSSSSRVPARAYDALDAPDGWFFRTFPKLKKVRSWVRTRGRNCSPSRAHPRGALLPCPWFPRWLRRCWRWIPRMRTLTAGGMSWAACG